MSGDVLRVHEDTLAFAKKDWASGILSFAFANMFSCSRRGKSLLRISDFRGSYLTIYKEFGDDPKINVVALFSSFQKINHLAFRFVYKKVWLI